MEDKKNRLSTTGTWSLVGMLILVWTIAYFHTAQFWDITLDMWNLFIMGPTRTVFNFVGNTPFDIFADISINLVLEIALVLLVVPLLTKKAKNAESKMSEFLSELFDKGIIPFFSIVLLEEVLARWLAFGILWPLFGKSDWSFYLLFFLGNGLWALQHLKNYKNKASIALVLPQFIGGFFLTLFYIKYGFWVTVFAHFYYNSLLMVTQKEQTGDAASFVVFLYKLALTVVLGIIMIISGTSIIEFIDTWLMQFSIYKVESLSLWQHVLAMGFISLAASLVGDLLGLDPITTKYERDPKEEKSRAKFFNYLGYAVYKSLMLTISLFIITSIASFFTDSNIALALAVVLTMSILQDTESGSAMGRAALINLPIYLVYTFAYLVFGFWWMILIVAILNLMDYIPTLIRVYVHDNHEEVLLKPQEDDVEEIEITLNLNELLKKQTKTLRLGE